MVEPTPHDVPIAATRPSPFAPLPPTRFPAVRMVLRAGTVIAVLSTLTGSACGLVAGGMHGVFAVLVGFGLMSGLGLVLATAVAVLLDTKKVVRDLSVGHSPKKEWAGRDEGWLSPPTAAVAPGQIDFAPVSFVDSADDRRR